MTTELKNSKKDGAIFSSFTKKSRRDRLMCLALAAVFTLVAFIMCSKELPYTSLSLGIPLSDALLCACAAYTPFVFLGNVLGTVYYGHASIERFLTLGLIFILRIISSAKSKADSDTHIFSEKPVSKLSASAVGAMASCAMYLASNGINGESARITVATLITLPVITLVFSVYFNKSVNGRASRFLYELSMLSVFSCAVYCATGITYAFCSLGTLFAVFLILCVAKQGGAVRAVIFGFVLGYITSPTYFLAYTLLGASSAIIFSFGVFSACGISVLIACISAMLVGGASSLITFVPEAVIATAVITPVLRYGFLPSGFPYPFSLPDGDSYSDSSAAMLAHLSSWKGLRHVSDGLKALSENVTQVTRESEAADVNTDAALERICAGFCERCAMNPICFDSESERTRKALSELISSAAKGRTDIPPYLSAHCIRLRELIERARAEAPTPPKINSISDEPLLLSYSSVASMLSAVAENAENELVFDRDAEKAIAKSLYSSGVPFARVSVIGKTRKRLYVYGAKRDKLKRALPELNKTLEKLFSLPYLPPAYDDAPNSPAVFSPAEKLSAEVAFSSACKSGETVNGDTALSFGDGDGNLYALIADGMGSGAQAGKSSALTAELVKGLMLSKLEEQTAMKLTGEALGTLCDECFSTVDLLKLDLVNGNATVTKSHASASYILRGGSVYCCDGASMPLGINKDTNLSKTELQLDDGDTVVMVSDGVSEGPQDSFKVSDVLGLFGTLTAKELADRILSRAIEQKGRKDDMSAMVIKIKKAS